jgi:hypothetical protein
MPQPNSEQTPATKPPADKFNDGPVHVSIWENGDPRHAFRVASFELRYQDQHRQWQTGHSYSAIALKHLESAAKEARTRIEKWKQDRAKPSAAPET